ncbi:MAG TPA: nucleotidyltransferase family protein [Thermoleophilaceae bacterium]
MSDDAPGAELAPRADIVAEARRVLDAANARDVPLRLIGGLAIALVAGDNRLLPRDYKDIDFVARRGMGPEVVALLDSLGYEGNQQFNALNGHRRLLYYDNAHGRQLDVFLGSFQMSHQLPIQERLLVARDTLPLADLLLTKLQVFALNEKDQRDVLTLLFHRPLSDDDADGAINCDYVASLCSRDWGLWRTCTLNLERIRSAVARYDLAPEQQDVIVSRIDELRRRIDDAPKSTRWKLRARVGERVRWYDEPEEVT